MVFHFSKISKMVRNQIRLDTNTNMYLEPKYTSVVFSLYKEGSFKIQLWEKRKSMFRKRKMLTCCQKIKIRISKYDVRAQILENPNWYEDKIHIWKLVSFPCLEKLIFNFHTKSIQHPYKIPIRKFANFSIL